MLRAPELWGLEKGATICRILNIGDKAYHARTI